MWMFLHMQWQQDNKMEKERKKKAQKKVLSTQIITISIHCHVMIALEVSAGVAHNTYPDRQRHSDTQFPSHLSCSCFGCGKKPKHLAGTHKETSKK